MDRSPFVGRFLGSMIAAGFLLWTSTPWDAMAQWLEEPGRGWVQLTVYHHATTTRFDEKRVVRPLFNEGGRSVTTSVFVTAVAGVVRGFDVWIQAPFHRLVFEDVVDERLRTGPGDPRFFVRVGPSLFGWRFMPLAIRGGLKVPLGSFERDVEIIPLSEGQRDWEVLLEAGHTFRGSTYAMAWMGYRWREINQDIQRKPGDEWLAFAAFGGSWHSLSWKLAAELLYGRRPKRVLPSGLEIHLPLDRREIVQLLPSAGYPLGPGTVELGARIPVSGRNLPAGPALFVGYFVRW